MRPHEGRVRSVGETRLQGSNERDRFTHSLTHCCLLALLDNNNRHGHFPSTHVTSPHNPSTTTVSEKARPFTASSDLRNSSIANSRKSVFAPATARCYADRNIPSRLRWTQSGKPVRAPAAMRYHRTTASLESHVPESGQPLR
jgi:hypothetical protein